MIRPSESPLRVEEFRLWTWTRIKKSAQQILECLLQQELQVFTRWYGTERHAIPLVRGPGNSREGRALLHGPRYCGLLLSSPPAMCVPEEKWIQGGCTSHATALAPCSGSWCQWAERIGSKVELESGRISSVDSWNILSGALALFHCGHAGWMPGPCWGGEKCHFSYLPGWLPFYDQPLVQSSDLSVLSSMFTEFFERRSHCSGVVCTSFWLAVLGQGQETT